jgi:hypothetical protein
VELLWQEVYSAALEVSNSTIGRCRKDSGSDSLYEGYSRIQEQRNLLSAITEEVKVKFTDNNVLYLKMEQDNDRQDEQQPNLSSSSTNTDFFPLLKTIKTISKPIPVILITELRTNKSDNMLA